MVKKMNDKKEHQEESNTTFFLNFISKRKDEKDKEEYVHKIEKKEEPRFKINTTGTLYRAINFVNETVDKALTSNVSIKILSFIMAIMLVYVTAGGSMAGVFSSLQSYDRIDDIPVVVEGLSQEYEVTGLPETVSVGIIGSSVDIVSNRVSSHYEAYVDLSNYGEGQHVVRLTPRNFSKDVEVMVFPEEVTITISAKVESNFSLGYKFVNENKMDSKYMVTVDDMSLSSVSVKASQGTLDRIDAIQALIDLTGVTDSFTQTCQIKAFDATGNELGVEIDPETVDVRCSVTSYSKEVMLTPKIKGTPANKHSVSKITLSASKVTIYGDQKDIEDIEEVFVNVDVNNMEESQTVKGLAITKVDGVRKMSIEKVDAVIELDESATKRIDQIPIQIRNNTENYEVGFTSGQDMATIIISGIIERVELLDNTNIIASIDVRDLGVGSHIVNVTIEIPDSLVTYEFISKKEITITLK